MLRGERARAALLARRKPSLAFSEIPSGHHIYPFFRSGSTPDVLPERVLGGMWCPNGISSEGPVGRG